MCDTFVALSNSTADGSVLLAKNADTEINEAQHVVRLPRREYPQGAQVRVTHLVIPQARVTHDAIINKSFWTYGAEIGLNEHGVAIGNEAVFTNQREDLDGVMLIDLLRLMLERAASADEAVEVVSGLLDRFGQGGNCELRGRSHFDGSFIISDKNGAVILETAGRHWAVKRVSDVASISNEITIQDDWDACSDERSGGVRIDFNAAYSDPTKSHCVGARERRKMSYDYLAARKGEITVRTMADLLRYTGDEDYDPMTGERPVRICMHAAPYEDRLWQATGALISETRDGAAMGWVTATSGPDVSIFKPVFPGLNLPDMGPIPRESFTPGAYWWRYEGLHRRAMADYRQVVPEIRRDFDMLEDRFFAESRTVIKGSDAEKCAFMAECWRLAAEAADSWSRELERRPYRIADPAYREMWDTFNRASAFELARELA